MWKAYFLLGGAQTFCNTMMKKTNALFVTAMWYGGDGAMTYEWDVECLTEVPGDHVLHHIPPHVVSMTGRPALVTFT